MSLKNPLPTEESQLAAFWSTGSVATVAVILRLLSRARMRLPLGADDYLSILATALFVAYCGVAIWAAKKYSLTPDVHKLSPEQLELSLKTIYIGALVVSVSIGAAKLSILFLYRRIFGVNRRFKQIVYIAMGWTVALNLAVFFACFARCNPIEAAWDPVSVDESRCHSLETIITVAEPMNGATEIFIILLPICMIRKLNLPLRQQLGISAIFAVGLFSASASILRVAEASAFGDPSIQILTSLLWVNIEMCTSIVTGCMPTYRGLLPGIIAEPLANFFKKCRTSIFPSSRQVNMVTQPPRIGRQREVDETSLGPLGPGLHKFGSLNEMRAHSSHHSSEFVGHDHGMDSILPVDAIQMRREVDVAHQV